VWRLQNEPRRHVPDTYYAYIKPTVKPILFPTLSATLFPHAPKCYIPCWRKASRAASSRRNEEVTGNENRGYLSSSSSEIEYEDDDEDDDEDEDETSRQLEVIGKPAARLRRE